MTNVRIAFLLPVVSQARYRKRINALKRLGAVPRVLAFERKYYAAAPSDEHVSLGRVDHGAYAKRLLRLARGTRVVRAEVAVSDVLYCFGLDMLLLGWVATRGRRMRRRLVYEVGDIRPVQLGAGVRSAIVRRLERFLVRRCRLVVVTSEAFWREYFVGTLGISGVEHQVIENKVDGNCVLPTQPLAGPKPYLRIGYFGLLRCHRSWEILKLAARRGEGRVHVYVRGFATNPATLPEEAAEIPHMEYGGTYLAPEELPEMYGRVDMVWACYPYHGGSDDGNWRWARTNRFYESCCFGRPLICQRGSADGEIVSRLGLGLSVDLDDVNHVVETLLAVTPDDIARWSANIRALPSDVYTYRDEHERLLGALHA